ncbi:MAG: Bifunctional IPC transferase and DIPP synthase [Candidatus Thorarchaeota archaeon]|nr:MAG: Bifunctional IPC transferase and DIPP synthase [Candidatus Thorarchaeota archaeon]
MPSRFRVRGIFRGLVLRIAKPLATKGTHPNTVTYFTLLLALFALLSLKMTYSPQIYGVFVFLVGLFDGVDGAVARLGEKRSPSGGFVDSVVDKVAEMLIIFAIIITYPSQTFLSLSIPSWAFLCLSGWLLTSYTRSRAESAGVTDLDIGLGGRSERLLTLVIFSLLGIILFGLMVVTIMGLLTAAYRYYHYQNELIRFTQSDHYI